MNAKLFIGGILGIMLLVACFCILHEQQHLVYAQIDDGSEVPEAAIQPTVEYGDKIRRTFMLNKGQTMTYLFAPGTSLKDVLEGWLTSPQLPDEEYVVVPPPDISEAQAMVAEIVYLLQEWNISWDFADLYMQPFALLPGQEDQKQVLLWMFTQLDSVYGVDLPFLYLPHGSNDPVPGVLDYLVANFGDKDLYFFYHQAADDSYAFALDVLDSAFNSQQACVLRHTQFELITAPTNERTGSMNASTSSSTNNLCCSKTTRACTAGYAGSNCIMCGSYCCLSSNWCPW